MVQCVCVCACARAGVGVGVRARVRVCVRAHARLELVSFGCAEASADPARRIRLRATRTDISANYCFSSVWKE